MPATVDLISPVWRKSSYSDPEVENCVEVATPTPHLIPVRDSKRPHSSVLAIPPAAWSAFITAIRTDTSIR
ncbi:DUF397 domain-containing protein [Streptomyces gamaensis]|uniref:DUF397 domain-containing protein n=1 Tax=Streptomyces gamaensis TaxID=1763542 RepID=A0ABW0Z3D1_9ACTN